MAPAYTFGQRRGFFSGFSLTNQLIFLNVVVYFFSFFILGINDGNFFLNNFALTPSLILQGKSLWTLLTSMFLHGSFFHIFANMFSLFFIGNFLEKIIGKKRFFWVYLIAGLIAGIFFVGVSWIVENFFSGTFFVFENATATPAVGASGAIFGLLGVLAVLVPYSKIYLIAGPLILILAQVLLGIFLPESLLGGLSVLINILILFQIFAMLSFSPRMRRLAIPLELNMWVLPIVAIVPLAIVGFFVKLPIGNSAHFGGLVVGLIYGFYLRKKFPRKTAWLAERFR